MTTINNNGTERAHDEVLSMASNVDCIAGDIPFNYLGLPIGSNMKSIASWKTLVDRFHMRLSSWKANLLSIRGRLTLIKSVLGSLGIYYLSIFRSLELVLQDLERIRAKFFWGGNKDKNKMAWVKWPIILNSFDKGGLNIGSLKASILALLKKWRWKVVSSPNAFGFRSSNLIMVTLKEDARYRIDQNILPTLAHTTTWDKSIPRKVNVFMWSESLFAWLLLGILSMIGSSLGMLLKRKNIGSMLLLLRFFGGFGDTKMASRLTLNR
ncbi:hypothetical protein Tco_0223693 [Tanacetum coccineum]